MSEGEIISVVKATVLEGVARSLESVSRDLDVLRDSALASCGVMTRHMVARLLGVNAATVMEYVRKSDLPCHRPGKAPLFMRKEVEAWVARYDDRGQILESSRDGLVANEVPGSIEAPRSIAT